MQCVGSAVCHDLQIEQLVLYRRMPLSINTSANAIGTKMTAARDHFTNLSTAFRGNGQRQWEGVHKRGERKPAARRKRSKVEVEVNEMSPPIHY